MAQRQLVILNVVDSPSMDDHDQAVQPLGDRAEVFRQLSEYNTWPDTPDGRILYGPGITVQAPLTDDDISQLLVSLVDEDLAWPVLLRICKETGWKLMDPESGRILG